MSRMEGASATRLIKLHFPDTAVIGISLEQKDYQLHAMQKAGAFEVLVKGSPVAELYSAIQRAATFVQPGLLGGKYAITAQTLEDKTQNL